MAIRFHNETLRLDHDYPNRVIATLDSRSQFTSFATPWRTQCGYPHFRRPRLVDTRGGSRKGHYVNHSVRGFRAPGSRRISSARFGPSRLRIRRIIRPQVVAPAIQSAPVATHSVATIAHLAFSLAGTILIPDCAPPQRLSPAFFPQLPPAPIHSSGRRLS